MWEYMESGAGRGLRSLGVLLGGCVCAQCLQGEEPGCQVH